MPIANLAVVHEGPVLPNKRMAIASVDRSASGSAYMSEKQTCSNMCCKRAKIGIVPGWQDVFEQSRRGALGIPSNTKSIAIGDPTRLGSSKALTHYRVLLVKYQVF
jgi:hypothetical protein